MENEKIIYLINKRNEIIEQQKELEKYYILTGMNLEYNEAFLYSESMNPDYVKKEYIKNNMLLEKIINTIGSKELDINPKDFILYRNRLISFINGKFDYKKDDISKLTFDVLDSILEELKRYLYENDDRFHGYGRRNHLEQEIEYYIGNGKILEAFVDFYEYIESETVWSSFSDIPENMNPKAIRKEDEEYKNEGIICEKEKEIIVSMVKKLQKYIEHRSM